MTELGIIQKVFETFRKEHPNSLMEDYWNRTIYELEQELIAEIEKEIHDIEDFNSQYTKFDRFQLVGYIRKLIGNGEKKE